MGFESFLGNERIVSALRGMLARERVASAMLFTGARGIGKYALARMFAQAANCERLREDFCGECGPCQAIGKLADPARLIEAGLAERGESADAAMVERVPLLLETHPDVWAIVPDPVRLRTPVARPMIRVGQLRAVQRAASFAPRARRRVFILDGADTIPWNHADLLLKILEEPPGSAVFVLLALSPDSLLPTIRSRCIPFHFAPVAEERIEEFLQLRGRTQKPRLAAQLAGGSPGAALALDLAESERLRRAALRLLEEAARGERYAEVFALTAQFAKQEKESFENILGVFYSLLTDLLEVSQGLKSRQLRNPDLRREVETLGAKVNLDWVARAAGELGRFESGLRRNISRQLGLDAAMASLALPPHRAPNRPAEMAETD